MEREKKEYKRSNNELRIAHYFFENSWHLFIHLTPNRNPIHGIKSYRLDHLRRERGGDIQTTFKIVHNFLQFRLKFFLFT